MDTIRGHIKRIPELLAPKIDTIKTNFDEWKTPWTAGRASRLDNLDAKVSTRATQASVDALSQGQKVIRGMAKFSIPLTNDVQTKTIELPQIINPEYANVSIAHMADQGSYHDRHQSGVVVNVTSTTIEIRLRGLNVAYTAHVEWQVVGGLD